MLTIRPATMDDREAVLAFCRDTFDWGDYIEYVYDDWLNSGHGELAVALFEERPVGISHVLYLSEHEAWFEGLRVDPDFRGKGVAKALTNYIRAGCFARGITVGRAFIEESNVASQSLSTKAGFHKVMEFRGWRHTAEPVARELLEEVHPAAQDDIMEITEYMGAYSGRMMAWNWHAQEVSSTALQRALDDDALYLVKRDGGIVCVAAVSYWAAERELDVVSYFCEAAADVEPLVKYVVNEQALGRVKAFHMFEADGQRLLDLKALGFETVGHGVSGLWEARL